MNGVRKILLIYYFNLKIQNYYFNFFYYYFVSSDIYRRNNLNFSFFIYFFNLKWKNWKANAYTLPISAESISSRVGSVITNE